MAEPVGPETGGRSLADILREAGIENPTRTGRRRRWDDMDDTGIRQRRAEAARGDADRAAYGRRSSDVPLDRPEIDRSSGMPRVRDERFRRQQPVEGERADRRPERRGDERGRAERPRTERPATERPRAERSVTDRPRREPAPELPRNETRAPAADPLRDTGRRAPSPADRPPAAGSSGPSTAAIPGMRPSRTPAVPAPGGIHPSAPLPDVPGALDGATPERERRRGSRSAGSRHAGAAPSTGPIPPVDRAAHAAEPAGDVDGARPEGAMAWLRFAGELALAAAVGVGVYFAFTVLWEMVPHIAALASPVVVTGLVLGVSTWRQHSGRGPLPARMLGVLVFAGTVLTILPAAALLSG